MYKVLVVDDSQIDRVLIEGLLRRDPELTIRTASDAAAALATLEEFAPDVLVTDLQMPEIDGLQLVTAVKANYPHIPVILITAKGSEHLAIEALEQGASSYVPKSQLNDKLLEAVKNVITLSSANLSYQRLTECMAKAELHFQLENDLKVFSRLVELVQQIGLSMGVFNISGQIRFGMAVEEALTYMMYRGNFELASEEFQQVHLHSPAGEALLQARTQSAPYGQRRLLVECRLCPEAATLCIEHQGPGFPPPAHPHEVSMSEMETAGSRSLILTHSFLDVIEFDPTGKRLTLMKKRG